MFKFSKKYQGRSAPKKRSNTHTSKVSKKPIFLGIGLVTLIFVAVAIYMLVQNFHAIFTFEYSGYAISGKKITENLLGNNEEEENNKKNLFLTRIQEQDKLYKKVNDYFVGETNKEEINLSYPIYINNNTALYNLSQDVKLITVDFQEISGYPNLTVSAGIVYNQTDLERIDEKEYIFLRNENNIFTNLKEITIQTTANEYIIPINSNVFFDKTEIRYYEVKKDMLCYKEIKDIDTQSKIKIGEKEVSYEELLTLLKLNQEEKASNQEEIVKEDTSDENEKKQEKVEKEEPMVEEPEVAEPGAYIKPEVTCTNFKANVYTASTELTIKDPSNKILEPVTFIFRKDGRIYLRKTYTTSGSIEVKGLSPNTSYEIEGSYIYENEAGQKVENTFYKDTITTTGFENLDPITLSFENGEIFSNKIQLKNLKIVSDLQNEAVKGIKRLEVEIGDVIYKLTGENLRKFIAGEAILYETLDGMKSNQKVYYTIKLYDNQGNELRVENNTGETRTSKQKPSVTIRLNKQNVIEVEIGLNLNNKDKVTLENYRYQITRPNGEMVKESGLKESDNSIYLNDLDPNQYYTITIYASYDLEDNKGKQENQIIGQTVFATQPLSTLGYLELNTNLIEIQTAQGIVEIGINENRTDKRLIQILDEIKIELIEIGKYNGESSGNDPEETREGNIVETITITGEELQNLKQGQNKVQIFENLISNTKYNLNITSKVKQGETIEEVAVTYSLKEFVTLKMPAEIQMKNLFVTGDLIDFDVRIEDIDKAVLTSKVRMELRDEKTNLIKLEEINTNEDYVRKTIEKLETGKTYTLSFYADQYNEGNTDETYKANYLLKELKIVTETGITGSIGITNLRRKATGKNLVDVSSEVNWYTQCFNTFGYYGKEYNEKENILRLYAGNLSNAYQTYTYDLREYIGQTVTISFKAKKTSKLNAIYLKNSKGGWNNIWENYADKIKIDEWTEIVKTLQVGEEGYIGFGIQTASDCTEDNYLYLKDLQIELGSEKTAYEPFQYKFQAELEVNLEDKKEEIATNDYYLKIYENGELQEEIRYEELVEMNEIIGEKKEFIVNQDKQYKVELVVKIGEREYVLDSQEFETIGAKEIKGIKNKEEFLDLQPNGSYIVLGDIDLTGGSGTQYRFGYENRTEFNGQIDFNGHTIIWDSKNASDPIFHIIGKKGKLKNLILEIRLNHEIEKSIIGVLFYQNYGIVENLKLNLTESISLPNVGLKLLGQINQNSGVIQNFIFHTEVPLYGAIGLSIGVNENRGIMKNGYSYGEGIHAIYSSQNNRDTGGIAVTNTESGMIQNIYTLDPIQLDGKVRGEVVGNIVGSIRGNSIAKNNYSVGIGSNWPLSMGPVIGTINQGNVENVHNNYYFADVIVTNSHNLKTTDLALYDTTFQNQILNEENAFEVDELVQQGYFPHLKMPDCMPVQEYISLPEVKDSDLADIVSTEVLEQGTNTVKVKFNVNNPSGETVTEIKIQNIECEILSQTYEDGKTEVIALLKNPIKYVSSYSLISVTTKGAYNLPYTRTFKENERVIKVDLYREIHTISDWKEINISPTENYKLMKDLNVINDNIEIAKDYSGKLDGANHTISNLRTPIFGKLIGEIRNLKINGVVLEAEDIVNDNLGIICAAGTGSILENIQINDVVLKLVNSNSGNLYAGGLIGEADNTKLQDCSISSVQISTNSRIGNLTVGGMLGKTQNITIQNSFVNKAMIQCNSVIQYNGVGGMIGNLMQQMGGYTYGKIQNCYVTGEIKTDASAVGGIVGKYNTLNIQNSYSYVNIQANDYIGGIAGLLEIKGGTENSSIQQNISFGNLYSHLGNDVSVSRIVGNIEYRNNYAYENQRINGEISKNKLGAILLSGSQIMNLESSDFGFSSAYDTSKLTEGYLPKLYSLDGTRLLDNQEDILFVRNEPISLENIEFERLDNNRISVRVALNNPSSHTVKDIRVGGMDAKISNITNQNGKTYVNFIGIPIKYYDSYQISEVIYEENKEEKVQEIEGKIEVQFFKELYTYEDWQSIEEGTFQNYRLMADIDFAGKKDMKTNVGMNRLESPGEKHSLKNIEIEVNESSFGMIGTIKESMKNISFENIKITNKNSENRVGVIAMSSADLENISWNHITIHAQNMGEVGCIGYSDGESMEQIDLNDIEIKAEVNAGGFIGKITIPNTDNITADNIRVEGGNNVGGLMGGEIIQRKGYTMKNITITNSNVIGNNYVGGVFARISGNMGNQSKNLKAEKTNVAGNSYVGGIAGNMLDGSEYYCNQVTIKGSGSYIGGIGGFFSGNRAFVTNSTIEGSTSNSNYVGGIAGASNWNGMACRVENSNIISKGSYVGGIFGITENYSNTYEFYNYNSKVQGYSYVGGISGSQMLSLYQTYNNAEVIATGHTAGGVIGYLANQDMTATYRVASIYDNYIADAKIQAPMNVGGIIGEIATDLYTVKDFYYSNYVEAELESEDPNNVSLGIGGRPDQNVHFKDNYYYQYSKINGENPTPQNEIFITQDQYLKEADLKEKSTYINKLKWSENKFDFSSLERNKYPLLKNYPEQEGINLPKDSEHIVEENQETENTINEQNKESNIAEISEIEKELPYEVFSYAGNEIALYEDATIITAANETKAKREERMYVKDGKLYVLDGSLPIKVDQVILDSYNGKEYETILGTDGKLYDLKEPLHYPENFVNENIKSITNNLHTEYKITTVTYKDGSTLKFNYQTGEVLEENKVEKEESIWEYIRKQLLKKQDLIHIDTTKYEESNELISQLEELPVEEAIKQKKEKDEGLQNTIEEDPENNTTSIGNQKITSNVQDRYLTSYNSETQEFVVYKEEDLLNVNNTIVETENEKIEKNNLTQYAVANKTELDNRYGIIWIAGIVIAILIGLGILNRRKNK